VRALESAKAPPEIIAAMKQETTLEGAQKLIAEQVDALLELLPNTDA